VSIGRGGTRGTCKDCTKTCYKRAPCRLNTYRQEGDEKVFMTFKHGDGWRLLRGAEGDSRVGGEDVTQGGMMAGV